MQKVTTKDVQRKYGQIRKEALENGVMITHHGHDEFALIPADVYKRLINIELRAHGVEELSREVIDGFGTEPVADAAGQFNHELG